VTIGSRTLDDWRISTWKNAICVGVLLSTNCGAIVQFIFDAGVLKTSRISEPR